MQKATINMLYNKLKITTKTELHEEDINQSVLHI